MQCCVSMAYTGVLGPELPFTRTVAREGFCDEVVGSRDPRGEGGTDVLGESSLVGEQQMQPLWVSAGQQESGVSRWGQPGTVLCGACLPCSILLGVPAPSHVISGSGAQLAGAAVPGSGAQPVQGFRNLSNLPHSQNSYDTNLNFHLICSCRPPPPCLICPLEEPGEGGHCHLAG